MGLLSIIVLLMAGVGFLTFGFTESVCGKPPNRYPSGGIATSSVIFHGIDYDFSNFKHPRTTTVFNGQTNPLIQGGWNLAGSDASFLFQKVNQNCLGLITRSNSSNITGKGNALDWYFPCNIYNQYGTSPVNLTGYESSTNCHITQQSRTEFTQQLKPLGQVFYTWQQVQNTNRNLAVVES
jgi:chitin synthase